MVLCLSPHPKGHSSVSNCIQFINLLNFKVFPYQNHIPNECFQKVTHKCPRCQAILGVGKLYPPPRYNEVHIDFQRACSNTIKGVAVLVAVVAQEEEEVEGELVVEAGMEVTMRVA